jgi:hypothetical protein
MNPPPPPATLPLLPCPLAAGWQVIATTRLPRQDRAGAPAGGYSAAAYLGERDELWLLSDAPTGKLAGWRGLRALPGRPLIPLETLPLRGTATAPLPAAIDGEGLVLRGEKTWVASEGRRSADRPAQLLRFGRHGGRLEVAFPLPADWNPGEGRGLAANQGPESLALLASPGQPPVLLMAAESALLQDPPGTARVLAWSLADPASPPAPLRSLLLPFGDSWGLTDLLVVPRPGEPPGLLGLQRRYEAPDRWQVRLALYPLPEPARPGEPPLAPLFSWDLIGTGLPPDNWEALTIGPDLADGRASLVLVSDDNFSPLQDNHLARIAPRQGPGCLPPP